MAERLPLLFVELPDGAGVAAVSDAVQRIGAACRGAAVSDADAMRIELASEEVLQNIVSHAGATAKVAVLLGHGEILIEIADDGPPFDPWTEAPEPVLSGDLEERPVGGLGVHLARTLMDRVGYRRDGARNVVELAKALVDGDGT